MHITITVTMTKENNNQLVELYIPAIFTDFPSKNMFST